jgi:cytochrome c peroxidase
MVGIGCNDDPIVMEPTNGGEAIDLTNIPYNPTPFEVPSIPDFLPLISPEDNPLTEEGIQLGRHLFYDPILSIDSTLSCSSCHFTDLAFTDGKSVSPGVDGIVGPRSSMSLVNIGYNYRGLFWDGRVRTLEEQAVIPIEDPIELNHTFTELIDDLQDHDEYPQMFREAFGINNTDEITEDLTAKAIAQFERILISGPNSKYDRAINANTAALTPLEQHGFDLFVDAGDEDTVDAECSHCHHGGLFMGDLFFNNGIDDTSSPDNLLDLGRGGVTGYPIDMGKFKAPTLRNIELTAPYMHDGRFATLEEVIEHYNSGGHPAPNLDQNIRPLNMSEYDKEALLAFLHTLTDTTYLYPDMVSNPH